jgi:hypothetical protein
MKKAYVIFPLIGLVVFGIFYWNTISQFDTREKQKIEERRIANEAKARAEFEARKKAIEDANMLQEKRKQEKTERDAREAREKQVQLELNDQSDKARDDKDRVLRQVDRLRAEMKVETEALDKIAKDRQTATDDEAFVQKYIKAAQANQKSLQDLLTKLDQADKEAAKAAAAAANTKKR